MMKSATGLVALSVLLAASGPATAASCEDVTFPDSVQVGGQSLVLNGLGLREATMFNVSVYVAALYNGGQTMDGGAVINDAGPRRLVLHFVRDVDGGDIAEAFEDGFEANNDGATMDAIGDRVGQLNGWMEDMAEGEVMTFDAVPGEGLSVTVRGADKGLVEGDDFIPAFLAIWFGDEPPNDGLKDGLLGGECG